MFAQASSYPSQIYHSARYHVFNPLSGSAVFQINSDASISTFNGKLGVNTLSPDGNLHVVGAAGDKGRIFLADADNGSGQADSLALVKDGVNASVVNRDGGYLQLGANNSHFVTLSSGGNVGINKASPTEKLHIDGGNIKVVNGGTVNPNNHDGGLLQLSNSDASHRLSLDPNEILCKDSLAIRVGNNKNIKFQNVNSAGNGTVDLVHIDGSSTNVGIGDSSPDKKLHITDSDSTPLKLQRTSVSGNSNIAIHFEDGNTDWYAGKAGGKGWGIGNSPDLNGEAKFYVDNSGDTNVAGNLDVAGNVQVNGTFGFDSGTSVTAISDNDSLGTSDNTIPTQGAVKNYVDNSSTDGFTSLTNSSKTVTLPNGFIMKWGTGNTANEASGQGTTTIDFSAVADASFPNTCFSVSAMLRNSSGGTSSEYDGWMQVRDFNKDQARFVTQGSSGLEHPNTFYWQAIGR